MNLLTVDYNVLLYVVIGAFALGGFLRGWWREGLTTVLLMILVVFLTQPSFLQTIIDYVNNLLVLLGVVIQTGGNFDTASVQTAISTAQPPVTIDPNNRSFYILMLFAIVILAYFTSRRSLPSAFGAPGTYYEPSIGARIIGAILGAFNGFVIINLIKEYIIGRAIPGTSIATTTAAPSEVAVQFTGVPPENPFTGVAMFLIGGIGLAIIAITIWSRYRIEKGAIKSPIPPGYSQISLIKAPEKK